MDKRELRAGIAKRLVQVLPMTALWGLVLFLSAGDWGWSRAWLYVGLTPGLLLINFIWVMRTNPEVIAARSKVRSPGTKTFELVIAPLFLLAMVGVPLVAGLDHRFDWAQLPSWTLWPGVLGVVLGNIPVAWSMAHNPHLERSVRIQEDRGHRVISTGPYAWVRHPMYAGVCLQYLALPLLFRSGWALVPGVWMCAVLAVRITFEEETLRQELPGYAEFAETMTRYRLVPGLW